MAKNPIQAHAVDAAGKIVTNRAIKRERFLAYGPRTAQVPRAWANHGSQVAEQALKFFGQLYDVEREVAGSGAEQRREIL